MEILLATINAKWIHPSLALRLLKANLGSLESACEIIEFALRQPLEEKVQPILAARPRILALSVSIWNHTQTLELLKALHGNWKPAEKPTVVLGGPEVSWLPENAEIFRYADYVIRGEGEESFRSLCLDLLGDRQPAGTDEGRNGNAVFINQGDTIVDVNKIEAAYRLYTDEDLGKKLVYVEASRGCPFGCEFCQGSLGHGPVREFPPVRNFPRNFPIEAFLPDMDSLVRRGTRTFKFLDRTFNLDIERAKRIMEFFLERIEEAEARQEKPPVVHFEMVPSRFPPEIRETLSRFPPGTLRLEIGIQTLNPETSSLIHRASASCSAKGQASEDLEALEFLSRETNAILHVDLIAGLPGENLTSFGAGFDRLWQALSGASETDQPCEIQLGILKCLPGTAIARHNETHGMRYSPEPPYEVLETGALPKAELDRVKNFARFWELTVNRNAFPGLVERLLPPGEPAFDSFMQLSDRLLGHFGRNWGIDRGELKAWLEEAFT